MKKIFLLLIVAALVASCSPRVLVLGECDKPKTEQLYIDSHNNMAVVYRDGIGYYYLSMNGRIGHQVPFYRVPYIKKLPMVVPLKD